MFKLIEARFTHKYVLVIQKLLLELGALTILPGEMTAKLIDRFDKMSLDITAIDAAKLPTDLQFLAILKNAIVLRFKLLNAILNSIDGLTMAKLREKFLTWELKNEIVVSQEAPVK